MSVFWFSASLHNNAIMHRPHAGWTNFPLLVCALTLTLAQTINKKFAAYGGRYESKQMKSLVLKTETENASFYVSSLAIGILEGMRSGGLPLESGIWSLARPIFWEALKKCEGLDARLIDWVSSMDEFDAIHELEGKAYKMIDEWLSLLKVSQTESLKGNPSLAIAAYVESNS